MDEVKDTLPAEGGQEQVASAQEQAPFFEFQSPDGKTVDRFASREELAKAWKDSYLRTSDYTRKTQDIAKQREDIEKGRKDFEEQQKMLAQKKSQYDKWDELLRARPAIQRQLMAAGQNPASPGEIFERAQGYVDEKYQTLEEKFNALMKEREAEKFQRELDTHLTSLGGEYKDLDRDGVLALLNEVSSGDTATLLRTLHWATKGQKSPAAVEQKVLEKIEQKRKAGIMPSSKATLPAGNGREPGSIKEAKNALLANLGGG